MKNTVLAHASMQFLTSYRSTVKTIYLLTSRFPQIQGGFVWEWADAGIQPVPNQVPEIEDEDKDSSNSKRKKKKVNRLSSAANLTDFVT